MRDFTVPQPAPPNSVIVIGFLGGFDRWNDAHRGVRKVALALRSLELPGVYVETIENRRRELALRLINRSVKVDGKGRAELQPRVILYGQSWGGAAVIHIARELQALHIGVRLTVQVDSVGWHDDVVPANVVDAVNIFQRDPFGICGRRQIRAEDPGSTRILENSQLSYLFRPYGSLDETDASWTRRIFGGSHTKMELDDSVWAHVEQLILAAIQR
jgi:hypothetical protein